MNNSERQKRNQVIWRLEKYLWCQNRTANNELIEGGNVVDLTEVEGDRLRSSENRSSENPNVKKNENNREWNNKTRSML